MLFGVLMAAALSLIGILQYQRLREAVVDEQGQALVDDLVRTAFATLGKEQSNLSLPRTLGESGYSLEVDVEHATFIVHVTTGIRAGKTYLAAANVTLNVENSKFLPGNSIYFVRRGENVVVSASPIQVPPEEIELPATTTPPEFYYFAKEKQREAVAIAASYYFVLENFAGVDAVGYTYEGDDILIQIGYRGGENLFGIRVTGQENNKNIGKVDNAWIVKDLSITDNLFGAIASPSIENANLSDWVYSHEQILDHLCSRTWQRVSDNVVVVVPADAMTRAAAATTNVSTYPTWRIEWQDDAYYVIYYQLMPWFWGDPAPGFVFQSEPELEPIT